MHIYGTGQENTHARYLDRRWIYGDDLQEKDQRIHEILKNVPVYWNGDTTRRWCIYKEDAGAFPNERRTNGHHSSR